MSHTWKKDSYGLFDREDPHKVIEEFVTDTARYFIRKPNNKVMMLIENELVKELTIGDAILCKVVPSEIVLGGFIIQNSNKPVPKEILKDKLWLDVNSLREDKKLLVL